MNKSDKKKTWSVLRLEYVNEEDNINENLNIRHRLYVILRN